MNIRNLLNESPAPPSIATTRFVVLDTELTGLNPKKDSLLSLGAIRMIGGTIQLGQTFHRLIRPSGDISHPSILIHGITPSEVTAEASAETVLLEFSRFCGDDILVGHFIAIDLEFVARVSDHFHQHDVIDTAALLRALGKRNALPFRLETPEDFQLANLARRFEIPPEGAHSALGDAWITAQIFQRLLPALDSIGVRDVDALIQTGIPFQGGEERRPAGVISNF